MDAATVAKFQQTVRQVYTLHGRPDLPWRQPEPSGQFDGYKILVSEVMLQQTQVARVIPAFQRFMARFPTVESLAKAPLAAVVQVWSGLGYNRRARYLHQAAQQLVQQFGGRVPSAIGELESLPGVGRNTAGAVAAYTYDLPVVFVETNIRTVVIHHFFANQTAVHDRDIVAVVASTLPPSDIRGWYWALMDYGSYLKQTVGNLARASAHHSRQPRFNGSRRQIRGQVLRHLVQQPRSLADLERLVPDDRLSGVLADLQAEGFLEQKAGRFQLGA